MKTVKDGRLFLQEIVDELPAESPARGFLLEAIEQMNAILPLDPYHMEVMAGPAALIRKAYESVDDVVLKGKLHFAMTITEHQARQKSGTR